jgi:AraC-like DNA-binding protein
LPALPPVPSTPTGAEVSLPLWPPLLATRGPGDRSAPHSHHAMHFVLATSGSLRARAGGRPWIEAAGVLTAPDVVHEIDARGVDVLIVFLEPESDVGGTLAAALAEPLGPLPSADRDELVRGADPGALMGAAGAAWTAQAARACGARPLEGRRAIHPRVRKLLRMLKVAEAEPATSLEGLAAQVALSPGRLMHVFTASIGIPLRPYLGWLRLQRAAGAIVSGLPLTDAAHQAGFSDAAHMTRAFGRMFGVAPSKLQKAARRGRVE